MWDNSRLCVGDRALTMPDYREFEMVQRLTGSMRRNGIAGCYYRNGLIICDAQTTEKETLFVLLHELAHAYNPRFSEKACDLYAKRLMLKLDRSFGWCGAHTSK